MCFTFFFTFKRVRNPYHCPHLRGDSHLQSFPSSIFPCFLTNFPSFFPSPFLSAFLSSLFLHSFLHSFFPSFISTCLVLALILIMTRNFFAMLTFIFLFALILIPVLIERFITNTQSKDKDKSKIIIQNFK